MYHCNIYNVPIILLIPFFGMTVMLESRFSCLAILGALILNAAYITYAKQVLELQGVNFELAITSYKYVAVLFYDKSQRGQNLLKSWMNASLNLDIDRESELATVSQITDDVAV